MRRRETQPWAQVARSTVADMSAGRCKLYCWGGDIRQLGSQLLCQEETLPWGQQYHQHQGNHGYQVHPAGRKKKRPVMSITTAALSKHSEQRRRDTGHLHARQEVRGGRWVQAHHGLLVFLLLQQGRGDLELQQGPGVGGEGVVLVRGHKPRSL